MVHQLKECPKHWKKSCHPCPCDTPGKPITPPKPEPPKGGQPPQTTQPTQTHNIVYLVDEHNITDNVNQKIERNGKSIQKRWAWHHQVANLSTFNVPELPDTIALHEKIGNPAANPTFRWEGFMFDIPGGNAACRVAIVAGADKADDATLTGPGGFGGAQVDRVVGFAGIYPDNTIPLGPIVQVRRDDAYRRLGASLNGSVKVAWHCAYYITKDTPKQPTPAKSPLSGGFNLLPDEGGNPDEAPAGQPGEVIPDQSNSGEQGGETYDQLLDKNVEDDVAVAPGQESWGGMVFGFTIDAPDSDQNDQTAFQPYDDSALNELKNE